jgi:hypothetical protein
MRIIPVMTACAILLATPAFAAPGGKLSAGEPGYTLVQDKKKSETVTQKVKRAWKNLVGYKFDVSCLGTRSTCSETGDSKAAAQSKCIARHPLCWVQDAN